MEKRLNIELVNDKLEQLGLSQAKLAEEIGVSREIVSKWLKNLKFPRPDKLLKLASILNLAYNEIIIKEKLNDPVIAFRKKGNAKTTTEHIKRAQDMGRMLNNLVDYLPFELLSKPASLIDPKIDYLYIQKVADEVRKQIQSKNDIIDFSDLIQFFDDLHAVIIPVLWGKKDSHENSLHIYLPESMTTWVFINLDTNLMDFKFWLAHELGHVKAPDFQDDDKEEFADQFAGALLFPEEMSKKEYNILSDLSSMGEKINHILRIAEELYISPITIYTQINAYAKYINEPEIDLNIYPATTTFNKDYQFVSEILFGTKKSLPKHYIRISEDIFKTSFFSCLKEYLNKSGKSYNYIQRVMNIPIADSKGIFQVLVNGSK
jgi:transcriptional regulator with XRE-family HTH domain